ncbi:MAG: hypothetical protein HXX20_08070 [Chloroflexi bacterium]|nr:hypothetical protein [Chloroflexota bacterium]
MAMKLTLAIALECSPTECKAQLLDSGGVVLAQYSTQVQARIQTLPGQLVALDLNPVRPIVVYRWHPGTVRQLKGDKVIVDDQHCSLIEASSATGLEVVLQVNDWVFVSFGYANRWEVADLAIDGRPTHIEYLSNYAFPKIEELYRKGAY